MGETDYNPRMLNQDCNRKLFNWLLSRIDILGRLRAAAAIGKGAKP